MRPPHLLLPGVLLQAVALAVPVAAQMPAPVRPDLAALAGDSAAQVSNRTVSAPAEGDRSVARLDARKLMGATAAPPPGLGLTRNTADLRGRTGRTLPAGKTSDGLVKDDVLRAYKPRHSLLAFLDPDALIPRVAMPQEAANPRAGGGGRAGMSAPEKVRR